MAVQVTYTARGRVFPTFAAAEKYEAAHDALQKVIADHCWGSMTLQDMFDIMSEFPGDFIEALELMRTVD